MCASLYLIFVMFLYATDLCHASFIFNFVFLNDSVEPRPLVLSVYLLL